LKKKRKKFPSKNGPVPNEKGGKYRPITEGIELIDQIACQISEKSGLGTKRLVHLINKKRG